MPLIIPTAVATITVAATAIPLPMIPDPTSVISEGEAVVAAIQAVVSMKAAGFAGGVVLLTQLAMKLLQTKFLGGKAGWWKLVALYALSVVVTLGSCVVAGIPLSLALVAGPVLGFVQNGINEWFKHAKPVEVEKK